MALRSSIFLQLNFSWFKNETNYVTYLLGAGLRVSWVKTAVPHITHAREAAALFIVLCWVLCTYFFSFFVATLTLAFLFQRCCHCAVSLHSESGFSSGLHYCWMESREERLWPCWQCPGAWGLENSCPWCSVLSRLTAHLVVAVDSYMRTTSGLNLIQSFSQ